MKFVGGSVSHFTLVGDFRPGIFSKRTANSTRRSLGFQRQTFAPQNGMSALPPNATAKADSRKRLSALPPKADVRLGSQRDREGVMRRFHRGAKRLISFQV